MVVVIVAVYVAVAVNVDVKTVFDVAIVVVDVAFVGFY